MNSSSINYIENAKFSDLNKLIEEKEKQIDKKILDIITKTPLIILDLKTIKERIVTVENRNKTPSPELVLVTDLEDEEEDAETLSWIKCSLIEDLENLEKQELLLTEIEEMVKEEQHNRNATLRRGQETLDLITTG